MGSRTTLSLKSHYGQFHTKEKDSFSSLQHQSISQNYQNLRKQYDDKFDESLKFGSKIAFNAATAYLIHFTPVVGDIYHAYQFAQVSYDYYLKVRNEYEKNPNIEQALLAAGIQEIKQLAPGFVKSMILQTSIDSSWENFKQNQKIEIKNPALESVAKSALYDTMEEIIS